jgi:2-succinyl-5-enolpyruvyl-6-hydroxy-3-cyclohexene-1-carboxylate synthase
MQVKMKKNWGKWSSEIEEKERIAESAKSKVRKAKFGNESRIILELLNSIPNDSNIFISNSLPIRDFDYFSSKIDRNLNVFVNRGASGIDGIISTASGIAADSKIPTYLLIGDLAFYHNISALSTLKEYNIPLRIILINNNGGNIFRMLPVSKENRYFNKYFITPQQLDYKKITLAFGGQFYLVKSWRGFRKKLGEISHSKSFSVMEFITDPHYSVDIRYEYWADVKKIINS